MFYFPFSVNSIVFFTKIGLWSVHCDTDKFNKVGLLNFFAIGLFSTARDSWRTSFLSWIQSGQSINSFWGATSNCDGIFWVNWRNVFYLQLHWPLQKEFWWIKFLYWNEFKSFQWDQVLWFLCMHRSSRHPLQYGIWVSWIIIQRLFHWRCGFEDSGKYM